jgi:hypothetical protein
MKLLIGGKNRNIYMRKDGSAYYKSGGQQVDVTHMFKKNGGGLKKQYISGGIDNLVAVEQKKRSHRYTPQFLGGAPTDDIDFDSIIIQSAKIQSAAGQVSPPADLKTQLQNICRLAAFGLINALAGNLKIDDYDRRDDKDQVKILANKSNENINHVMGGHGLPTDDAPEAAKVGLTYGLNEGTVSRAYKINKILQCFLNTNIVGTVTAAPAAGANTHVDPAEIMLMLPPPRQTEYAAFTLPQDNIIDPKSGDVSVSDKDVNTLFVNIATIAKLDAPQSIQLIATNLHTVLFLQELIGAY